MRRPTLEQTVWILALICGVAPLWASQVLPLVDLPQHLHLISALHRLDDATTLYPQYFARRPELTPYLGYYYVVSFLNWLLPLETANKVFLTAYVAGLPLSLAFLLRSLERPTWPALLAIPFAYGDSFKWGFINYLASLPLAILTCGFFVRAIADAPHRRRWAGALAASLVTVLLFHVQTFAWLAIALPLLLLTTPAPEGRGWKLRVPALLGVVPGVALFFLWFGGRMSTPPDIRPGEPWHAWGPTFSAQNLAWKGFAQNLGELVSFPRTPAGGLDSVQFPILAGIVRDGSDQWAVRLAFLLALVAVGLGVFQLARKVTPERREGPLARWRMLALGVLALILFFALPFDIRGYVYYLNTRYAHLTAALLVCAVPVLEKTWARRMLLVAALVGPLTAVPLWRAFSAFDEEASHVLELAKQAPRGAKVMGLIFNTGSRLMTQPVFLHASCFVAREQGGITNFSFASTPHNPLLYKSAVPPTFPSEWRPDQMNWDTQGRAYDTFVVRGVDPRRVFREHYGTEVETVAQSGDFFLVRKR